MWYNNVIAAKTSGKVKVLNGSLRWTYLLLAVLPERQPPWTVMDDTDPCKDDWKDAISDLREDMNDKSMAVWSWLVAGVVATDVSGGKVLERWEDNLDKG